MTIVPPYLKKGDQIGIVCPAGFMAAEKVAVCIQTLQQWGYRVVVGRTIGGESATYFAGTDQERLDDFQEMLNNDDVSAILCARGGYGSSRIIDQLDFSRFRKRPKWIIGFSDITVFHAHLLSKYRIASFHAPMAAAFNDGEAANLYILSLKKALTGRRLRYECAPDPLNREGEAIGELVGGNLAMIAHLAGSVSEIKTKDMILFLEDVGEYLYNIDRMLYQLKRAGKFDKLAAVIIGGFTDLKDTERPFGKSAFEIIHEIFNGYAYPICYNFPVSHAKENVALKVGLQYKLKVGKNKVVLEEIITEPAVSPEP